MTVEQKKPPERPKRRVSVIEALEQIEDVLVQEGYDNIIAPTDRGSFHWTEAQRSRQLANDKREKPIELEPDEHFQQIEDALLKAGFDDYAAVTKHGCFRWMTAE